MAGAGYKLFVNGNALSASDLNTYVQQQTVMVFASASARTTALTGVLAEGMVSYRTDSHVVEVYNGTSWVAPGASSPLTTKGDLWGYNTTDARVPVGTDGQLLKADSTNALGVSWTAAPSATGAMVQIATGSMTGASITLSSLSNYQELILQLVETNINSTSNNWNNLVRINGDSSSNYIHNGWEYYYSSSNAYAIANGSSQNALMATTANDIYGTTGNKNLNQYIKLTNCKTTGYTDFRTSAIYSSTANSGVTGFWVGQGVYTVSGTVSSLVLSPSFANYGTGTYTLWGA